MSTDNEEYEPRRARCRWCAGDIVRQVGSDEPWRHVHGNEWDGSTTCSDLTGRSREARPTRQYEASHDAVQP